MKKADLLDKKILRVICVDARRSFKEIAGHCGVSRAAIHQRVVRMFERGVITGSGYQVNPKFLGFGTCSFIGIKLERGNMYHSVVQELQKIPEVVECHFTTGAYGMIVKLYSQDNEHLKELLTEYIQQIPGVNGTDTMISLEQSIQRNIPISLGEGEETLESVAEVSFNDEID